MDMRKQLIVQAVTGVLKSGASVSFANQQIARGTPAPLSIIERNDAPVRKAEGLELRTGVLEGAAPSAPVLVELNGTRQRRPIQFEIDLLHGHKTGFYLDQRDNYQIVADYA